MPVPYDFKDASFNTPRRKNSGGKRLRFFVLLLIVGAITVGGVMILIPKDKTVVTEESGKDEGQKESDEPEKIDNRSEDNGFTPPGGANDDVSSGNKTQREQDKKPNKKEHGKSSEGTTRNRKDSSGQSGKSSDGGRDNDVAVSSGKGRELPGDLSAGDDKPVFRDNQAPGGAEALAKAATLSDPDGIMASLTAFLMKEYSAGGEYSSNWNAAGKELAAALRRKAQNGDWKAQSVVHKVAPRDNFIKIARRYHATPEGIKVFNKRKSDIVRIGDKFSVVPGPWRITLSKKARLLNLWRKEKDSWRIFGVFPIGVGRKNLTPNGKFVISLRLRHPKWHGPDGRIFAYGDKENPLGDYFLKLRPANRKVRDKQGYGIHGSADDSSMGRSLSNGCIRMNNCDVEMLYYLLPAMTPVEITD